MLRFRLQSKRSRWVWIGIQLLLCQPGLAFESFESVRARTVPSEGVLYDRHHEVLQEYRRDPTVRQLEWVPLGSISPALKNAVVFSEDRSFWNHHGVDWKALVGASVKNLVSKNPRGASTITMQLASILDRQLLPRQWVNKKKRRDIFQKVKQVQSARELEKSWSKEQLLEAYFNLIFFRGELRGVAAASQGLFSKDPHGIDSHEALILAALIPSPAASVPEVERRACSLGKQMDPGFQCDPLKALVARTRLQLQAIRPALGLAPHLMNRLQPTAQAQVTVDRRLQEAVLETLQKQILSIQNKNAHDAAALVVDNRSGEVLAYVGGVGALSSSYYVDGVRAERQAGSSLKPFLYGMALDHRYLTAASFLDDSPLDIAILGSLYRPKNYDNDYHGKGITVRTALAASLNIPAVKTLNMVGVEAFVRELKSLGFQTLRKEADYYGPSLALGAADITLWDLVNAYRTLANQGVWSELTFQLPGQTALQEGHGQEQLSQAAKRSDRKPHRVFSRDAAFIISDILSDRESRSLTFGLENSLALKFWSAVKTGTSKDMRDNWCVGYSDRYTVGVWVGNFSGEPMWNVTGMTGAAPAWAEIMKRLHPQGPKLASRSPQAPLGVVKAGGAEADRQEWYLKGTEPESGSTGQKFSTQDSEPVRARILYPVEGMIIARDPDIPAQVQRVFFDSNSPHKDLKWLLNGEELRSEGLRASWNPTVAGTYRLSLVGTEGKVLDTVRFSVR